MEQSNSEMLVQLWRDTTVPISGQLLEHLYTTQHGITKPSRETVNCHCRVDAHKHVVEFVYYKGANKHNWDADVLGCDVYVVPLSDNEFDRILITDLIKCVDEIESHERMQADVECDWCFNIFKK